MTLPLPDSERWKPLRTGLVDIFHYDAEEFRFHDGRLLLRGNNGTGKSKVLALTLPFLLDGELSPYRVEPDGDRQKRMEWNLLLGGRHPHPERLGYTWLEFGRRAPDGTVEYKTIGCGLKAVRDRGITRHWFFVTGQRVGEGLALLSAAGVTITRDKLRDALDGHGTVYDRASDYRRAVDAALFGLGEQRYEALVNLLIQLRQPQLSKRPDERLLSRALTEALPPISPALVDTVAEALRGLDEERHALRALEETSRAADAFLIHYRRYSKIAAKRKAGMLRVTHSRYEHLGRDLVEADNTLKSALAALTDAERKLKDLEEERLRLEARQTALRQSPEMRDAQRLKEAGAEAARLTRYATDRHREASDQAERVSHAGERAKELDLRQGRAESELSAALDGAEEAAGRIGSASEHRDAVRECESDTPAARRTTAALSQRRSAAINELERLFAAVESARHRWERARDEVTRLTGESQEAVERIAAADAAVVSRADELGERYRIYLAGLTEIPIPDPDVVRSDLSAWSITESDANPAATAVGEAVQEATSDLARADAVLERAQTDGEDRLQGIRERIRQLESGGTDAPPAPHTRTAESRAGLPGTPLWRAVDFTDALAADHRAGLEAALEAAGLLDAWITPDGHVLSSDDTFLLTGPVAEGPTCAAVLRPAVDRSAADSAAIPSDQIITAVLERIGLGPGAGAWVAADGRWANGVLAGSWRKDSAVFIGEGARETARREQLAAARTEAELVEEQLGKITEERRQISGRRQRLSAEYRELPSDTPLREAHIRLAEAHGRRRELDEARETASGTAERLRRETTAAVGNATEFAQDVGLPTEPVALPEVKAALSDYQVALAGLWPAIAASSTARTAVAESAAELAVIRERADQGKAAAEEAHAAAAVAEETYRALVETAGAGVEELFRQLRDVEQTLVRRGAAEMETRTLQQGALLARGQAEGRRSSLQQEIRQAVEVRDRAVEEFRSFAGTGVLSLALPEAELPDPAGPWTPTAAVQLARSTNTELDGTDDTDGPWNNSQRRVAEEHKLLSDAMSRHGHSVGMVLRDGIMLVDVVFQGRTRDIPELAAALTEETGQRARLLSAQEREILENHLLSEVAGALHELIITGEEEVAAMNGELTARPTSTGMTLRLLWRPAKKAPEGLEAIRAKLRQTIDAWDEGSRAAVGRFLQEQIAREHAENPSAGWTDQLTRALDYRRWHEFVIQRRQDGHWRPATGPASGGERVLAASIPLFAAASAYYKSATNPHAPRLVALDEAFAGVDDDSRAKCLGLLATFDMDVVMTSEREWGCYPQVPGLAICQLSRRDGIDAVLVTPWRWDGRERTRTPRPGVSPPAETKIPPAEEALFS
ncbi:TIGR02680 family protein [Actinocorallia longicatena]|uniref:TIGR02680 family protein n=1 Tax=Actinocorallia longicatena TaxID=111803 RepID=A0ABP6QB24_9ACTN